MKLALPKGPLMVIEAINENNVSVEFKSLLKHWKKQWSDRKSVPKCAEMIEMMGSQVDATEDFRQNFVMFIVSRCLCGN